MNYRSVLIVLLLTLAAPGNTQASGDTLSPVRATIFSQHLLPDSGNIRDIGSSPQSWRNIYMTGNLYWNGMVMLHATGGENLFSGPLAGNKTLTGTYNTATGFFAMNKITSGDNNTAHGHGTLYANTTGYGNAAFGANALKSNITGNENTALGNRAMYKNESGRQNTAIGHFSLYSNTTGYGNTAAGFQTMFSNINGEANFAAGFQSLYSNTSGTGNTASGFQTLYNNTTGRHNTATGLDALFHNTTGNDNTALGVAVLSKNTSGNYNTASGTYALNYNTNGSYNTASGHRALNNNTAGSNNTANGSRALFSNTVGDNNMASGTGALYNNTIGRDNTGSGYRSLYDNTSGSSNTAYGAQSLYYNTTGSSNTASGRNALYYNTTGTYNTGLGRSALYSNVTGEYNTASGSRALYENSTGSHNTASGSDALYKNSTGTKNTAVGYVALRNNTSGYRNTAHGAHALEWMTTGSYNTAHGFNSFSTIIDGSLNTALGAMTGLNPFAGNTVSNSIVIGAYTWVSQSNQVVIGNGAVTSIGGAVSWTTFSDGRFKKNIQENIIGLEFINSLRPVSYTINTGALNKYYETARVSLGDSVNDEARTIMDQSMEEAGKIIYDGFVAQEVEAAAAKLNFNFSGVDKPKNSEGLYGLRYDHFVVPLVKAVQELSRLQVEKDKKIEGLQQQINELKALITGGAADRSLLNTIHADTAILSNLSSQQSVLLSAATLEQNVPNPFSNTTTIAYTLPEKFSTAYMIVTDGNGKTIKRISITGSGKGTLHIEAPSLSSGTYQYSLVVDGKLIATRQMILAK